MVLYNVTVNVDSEIENDWLDWMRNEHIPEVMETGFFEDYKILRMLTSEEDETGKTYAIQYQANELSDIEIYLNTKAPKLQKASIIRYGSKTAAFRTVLEEV